MKKTRAFLCLLLALAMLLSLCACTVTIETVDDTEQTQTTEPTTETPEPETTEPTTEPEDTEPTTEATEPEDTEPTTEATEPDGTEPEDPSASLLSVRQAMVETPQLFAMAYLGYVDETIEGDTLQILEQLCPNLLTDLPFIAQIPDEHVIGGSLGELYLFVPRDEAPSIRVGLLPENLTEDMAVTKVLYQEVSGDPLLIYANGGGFEPNIEVSIVSEDGIAVEWYPYIDEYGYANCPIAGDIELALDLTDYGENEAPAYIDWMRNGWNMPDEELLYTTGWTYIDTSAGEHNVVYSMDLLEGGEARFYSYIEGETDSMEEYEGEWNTHVEGEFRYLNLNLERTGGMLYQPDVEPVTIVDSFPLLVHFSEAYLMLGKGLGEAPLPFVTDGEITAVFECAAG